MLSVGVDGVETAKHALQEAVGEDRQFRVLLLDMWLHGEDSSDLVHFLYEKPCILGTTPRFSAHHKSDSVTSIQGFGDLENSSSGSENDEVCIQVQKSRISIAFSHLLARRLQCFPLSMALNLRRNLTLVSRSYLYHCLFSLTICLGLIGNCRLIQRSRPH